MANGTMKQRSKDSWTIWVSAGKDPSTGKYKQRTQTVTRQRLDGGKWESDSQLKKRAESELRKLLVQRDEGIDIAPDKLTVSTWLDTWLAGIKANVGGRTYASYKSLIENHIRPVVGTLALKKLRPSDVRRVYALMYDAGRSGTTMLHCHRVLRQALRQAVRDELIPKNVADLVSAPKADTLERPSVPEGELARIVAEADKVAPYGTLVRLTLWTGLRLGEALGLSWSDIDLEKGVLQVRQTFGNDGAFRTPKTERSRRTMSLDSEITQRLSEHRQVQLTHYMETGFRSERDLVFADAVGEPIPQYRVNYAWRTICRKAGVDGVRFHDLRHAAATLALANGVDVAVVSRRLGHSTPSTTLNIYRHIMPSEDQEAAGVMTKVLAGSG